MTKDAIRASCLVRIQMANEFQDFMIMNKNIIDSFVRNEFRRQYRTVSRIKSTLLEEEFVKMFCLFREVLNKCVTKRKEVEVLITLLGVPESFHLLPRLAKQDMLADSMAECHSQRQVLSLLIAISIIIFLKPIFLLKQRFKRLGNPRGGVILHITSG